MSWWVWLVILGAIVLLVADRRRDVQQARPAAQPLRERMGAGGRPAPQAIRPHPEPRGGGQGLRRARARGVRGSDGGAYACAAGAGRAGPGAGGERADGGDRTALRRGRGVSRAPRDRELPAAPGSADRGRGRHRRLAPGLQRHGALVRERARDGADEHHRRHLQLPARASTSRSRRPRSARLLR